MKDAISPRLRRILSDTASETEESRSKQSLKRLKQMVKDAPEPLSFYAVLVDGGGLIAEIKQKSPSQGPMLRDNVVGAISAYKKSPIVKAISVLTNRKHFGSGMRLEFLRLVKERTSKPVLRKDFITDEYQVYQARAYGADAILLMANILKAEELEILSSLATSLGMDVLFEIHRPSELEDVPKTAKIIGVNCRNFDAAPGGFRVARIMRQWFWASTDKSVNTQRFEYGKALPASVIKVAESGVTPDNFGEVFSLGFHAALVGTSLLMDKRGIGPALKEFEEAISGLTSKPKARKSVESLRPALA